MWGIRLLLLLFYLFSQIKQAVMPNIMIAIKNVTIVRDTLLNPPEQQWGCHYTSRITVGEPSVVSTRTHTHTHTHTYTHTHTHTRMHACMHILDLGRPSLTNSSVLIGCQAEQNFEWRVRSEPSSTERTFYHRTRGAS